jgi:hypothetical protein
LTPGSEECLSGEHASPTSQPSHPPHRYSANSPPESADAALKVLYLVIQDHKPNRKNVDGKTVGWKSVINTLTLYYEDRITINN